MAGRIVRWGAVLGLGAVWWWALLRVVVAPDTGALEGVVVAGGWGLSLLPVHTVSKARAVGAVRTGRWRAAWRAGDAGEGAGAGADADAEAEADADGHVNGGVGVGADAAKASPRRRWGAGFDLS